MGLRKIGVIIGILFAIIFLSSLVSADKCEVKLRAECTPVIETIVMSLVSNVNAHGGLNQESPPYDYVLCCDFGSGDTTCGGPESNEIIGLSGTTNAHGEVPGGADYSIGVCYDDLACTTRPDTCTTENPIHPLSLSALIDGHLGSFGTYPTKICCCNPDCGGRECGPAANNCGGPNACGDPCSDGGECNNNGLCVSGEAYWANANDLRYLIDQFDTVVPGETEIAMVLTHAGTTPLNFEIYEDDPECVLGLPFGCGDDEIRTGANAVSGDLDANGKGVAYWEITQEDLDETGDLGEFYFMIDGKPSGYLALTILDPDACLGIYSCSGYSEQPMCVDDSCGRAVFDIESLPNVDITCGDDYICECAWDEATGCGPRWTAIINDLCGNGKQETGEECDDGNTDNNDGCSSDCEYEIVLPPCPVGTTLCSDNTCSINCDDTDQGTTCNYDDTCDAGEGCTCRDCDEDVDTCDAGLECSLIDEACCEETSDGTCTPNCAFIDPDCISSTHTECNDNMCVEVDGDGVNECSPIDGACDITNTHADCSGQMCMLVDGQGPDLCSSSSECTESPTHTECNSNMCVEVAGDGSIECAPIGQVCTSDPGHAECSGQMCIEIIGVGSDLCSVSAECDGVTCGNGIQETGEECDDDNTNNGDGCSSDCEFEDDITPPCLIGLTLCSDNTCSINCGATDDGTTCDYDTYCDSDEGCTCRDCNEEVDTCLAGLECSIADQACCKDTHDGICIPNCAFIDPDCGWAIDPDDPGAGEIGTCTYNEGGSDNCDDGFLHYEWGAVWEWGDENGFFSPNLGPSNNPNHYIIIPPVTGLHYFDPERLSDNCDGVDNTIVCPAKMQITFFNLMNLVIAIVVLAAFYIVFKKYKKKKKK